jgi:hypothetical protein
MKNTILRYYRVPLVLSVVLLTLVPIMPSCGGGGGGGTPPPSPSIVYSNATLTDVWMAKATVGPDTLIDSFRFDGIGSMVEEYILNPGTLPSPYNVQADGSFTYDMTFAYDPTITITGKFTSATAATIGATVSGTAYSGTLRKVMDLGACQGTWSGTMSAPLANSFQITVDNTGTIVSGSGFATSFSGKLFCESGDATGIMITNAISPLDRVQFHRGTVASGPPVTISGNYETNNGSGTYTLVRGTPPIVYSNATLTGIWITIDMGADRYTSFKSDGNGSIVEDYGINWSASPVTLPYPYNVQADGSFTVIETHSSGPSVTITGTLTSATTGTITTVDGSPVTGTFVKRVMDLGACQGTWSGQLAGGHTNSFQISVDNTGTITGGSGFTGPIGGKLFCESGRATGLVTTGESPPMDVFTFTSGTVVSGATVTISGNYDMISDSGTYTLATGGQPSPLAGTWFGTLEDLNGDLYTLQVTVNANNTVTDELVDGSATGVTHTAAVVSGQTQIFSLTGSDGSTGGFYVDSSYTHAVFVDDNLNFAVMQKGATSFPTYTTSDAVGTWSGFEVELNTDFSLFDTFSSTMTISAYPNFSDSNKYGTITGSFWDFDSYYGGLWADITSPATGYSGVFMTPDKKFLGGYSCPDSGYWPEDCLFSAWNK